MENKNFQENNITQNNKKRFSLKGKKKFIIPIIVLIVGFLGFRMFTGGGNNSLVLNTYTVKSQDIEKNVSVTGTVKGSDSAEISSNLNYEFIKINVKEGDYVKKGDILGVLNSNDLSTDYNISLKEYEIAKSQHSEQQKTTTLLVKERELDYSEAKRQNEITKALYEEGSVSKDELVQSNLALEKASMALANAKNQLSQLSSSGSSMQSIEIKKDMLNSKKANLDKANITSPIDGTVTRVNAKLGRIPTAQDQARAMFIVEDLDNLILNVKISEYDISDIKVGQDVVISSDMLKDKTIEGTVIRIAPTGESVQEGATTEMKIPVEIKIKDSKALIAGVKAKAKIVVAKKSGIVAVPIEAVVDDGTEKYILLGNDGIITKTIVTTGLEDINYIEITSGNVKEGDIVITNPSSEYQDGQSYTGITE